VTDLRTCHLDVVRTMCERFHGYGSAGNVAAYAFAVYEDERPVAAFAWQPPPPGVAAQVCPEAPQGVLALSRMVAVPREERRLRHISKPLRLQMRWRIDRTRWPVLITFSDEGQGHSGHVYKCSGWQATSRNETDTYTDEAGRRVSRYSNGITRKPVGAIKGTTFIQRWEHWACERGQAGAWMASFGWRRVPTGRQWRSGSKAYRWERAS
jgi:hypothetical protein